MKRRTRFWTSGFVKWICLLLVCALSLTLLSFPNVKSAQAAGQVYYVDNSNGSDTNNGLSEGASWKTIAKVNSVSFSPGDQILFKRGETWLAGLGNENLIISTSGTAGSPIIFGSYGSGNRPIIDAEDYRWTCICSSGTGHSYITIQELDCRNAVEQNLVFVNTDHITIHDCVITGSASGGILFDSGTSFALVEDCTIYDCIGGSGIAFRSPITYSRAHNNIIHNCEEGISVGTGNPIADLQADYNEIDGNDCYANVSAGLYLTRANYNLVHNNHFHHNVGEPPYEPYGIGVRSGAYNEIYDNEIDNNAIHGIEVWGGSGEGYPYDYGSNGNKIYRNKFYNNGEDGIRFSGNTVATTDNEVYYNLIYSNNLCGLWITAGAGPNNKVYNNTIVGNLGNAGGYYWGMYFNTPSGWDFKNNIVANNKQDGGEFYIGNCTITHDHNLYHRTTGNVVDYNGATYDANHITDFEATALTSDPLFVDEANHDYHLQSGSPAINAGTDVSQTIDLDGNSISGQLDIGAYEYQGTLAPPTPTLTLAIPNSGESWQIGSNQTLQWSSTNLTGNVKLELSRDGGIGWETLFASVANSGSQVWAVSGPATTSARIKVSSVENPNISDISDSIFTLTAPAPTPPTSFTLAGQVTQADSSGLNGVTLSLSDGGGSVVTANGGLYSITVPSGWSGQLTPSYSNGGFDPVARLYSNVSANQSGQDFRWTAPAAPTPTPPTGFTLAGQVTQADNSGLNGVTLSLSDGGGSVVTANGGLYSLTVPSGWSGQVTSSYGSGSFDPVARLYANVSVNQSGQDFRWTAPAAPTPTPPTSFTLAGQVTQADSSGLNGVTLSLSDGGGSVVTANGGLYSITVPSGWSGQLTPSYSNGGFDPVARLYSNVSANQSGQDFRWTAPAAPTPTPPTGFTLAGQVTQADNSGLNGVTLSRSDGSGNVVTTNGGSYSITVPSGWSGQLTPSYGSGSFEPAPRSYSKVSANQSGQDFRWTTATAPSIRVLTPNGGESWQLGSKQRITWTSANLTGNISIELSLDGGQTWAALFTSIPNDGQEQWTVTGVAGSQNQIRITSTATPSISDTSDSNFAIVKSKRKIRIAVNQGWNLIATPVQPDSNADQIFANLPSGWRFYAWDSASLRYLTGMDVVSSIGNGYWLYSPIASNLDIEGDSYAGAQFKKTLPMGWNLIGSPSTDSYQLGNLRIELNANIYTYQEALDLHLIAPGLFAYKGNQYEDARTTGLFEPGFGYWIKTIVGDCILVF